MIKLHDSVLKSQLPPPTDSLPPFDNRNASMVTSKEKKACRDKGLCYCCPDKYVAGHECRGKQIFLIEVEEHNDVDHDADFDLSYKVVACRIVT